MRTHYEVLGVEPHAQPAEIRAAYLAAARRHHPDHHTERTTASRTHAEVEMREINGAWQVLGDPAERSAYDRSIGLTGDAASASGASPAGENISPSYRFTPFEPSDPAEDEAFDRWRYGPDDQDPETTPPKLLVALGPLFAAMGVALVLISVPLGVRAVLAAGVICLALGALMFIGAPMFAMLQSQDVERRRSRGTTRGDGPQHDGRA